MAVYLKSLPQRDSEPPPTSQARLVDPAVMELGRKVYATQCAVCHGDEGKGQRAGTIRRSRATSRSRCRRR